jgi:hypothetical protein
MVRIPGCVLPPATETTFFLSFPLNSLRSIKGSRPNTSGGLASSTALPLIARKVGLPHFSQENGPLCWQHYITIRMRLQISPARLHLAIGVFAVGCHCGLTPNGCEPAAGLAHDCLPTARPVNWRQEAGWPQHGPAQQQLGSPGYYIHWSTARFYQFQTGHPVTKMVQWYYPVYRERG